MKWSNTQTTFQGSSRHKINPLFKGAWVLVWTKDVNQSTKS